MLRQETLSESRSPHTVSLDFPGIHEETRLGAFIGFGQTLVHPVSVAEESVLVQMVKDTCHLRMIPCVRPDCNLHSIEIGPGLVTVRKVDIIERPE